MFKTNEDVLEDIMRWSLIQHLVIHCGGNVGFVAPGRVPLLALGQTLTARIGEYIGRENGGLL